MSLASVKAFFAVHAPDIEVIELEESTATVELAAKGHGVAPAQIAKRVCLKIIGEPLLVGVSGTARLVN
jgi:prolyl-tRNA editing enzyme YbaK/EbsC (Cys-tRNA(Pro) deacylase)